MSVENNEIDEEGERKLPAVRAGLESKVEHNEAEPEAKGRLDSGPWAELAKFLKEPTRENLGKVDYSKLEPRDVHFMKRLETLSVVDPEILRRVVIMRTKLANNMKLTQGEASELLESLSCKGFYLTDLNIQGYQFGTLDMDDVVVGRNFKASYSLVKGDNYQSCMRVGGENHQVGVEILGDNDQSHMEVGSINFQSDMKVLGDNNQRDMHILSDNEQVDMRVGGKNYQDGMKIDGENMQRGMKVGAGE